MTAAVLPDKLARRIAGTCCYGACAEGAMEGSDYCAPHDAHEKGRAKTKQKRRRLRRAAQGLCVAGCGRKVGKRVAKGRVVQRRCPACAKKHRAAEQKRRGVPGASRGVPGATDGDSTGHVAHIVEADGYTRERYVGRSRRGAPSKEDRDNEIVRDLGYAGKEVDKARVAFGVCRTPAVQALPRIQRDAARAIVRDHVEYACRFLEDIADRLTA